MYNTNGTSNAENNMVYNAATLGTSVWVGQAFGTWPSPFPASTQQAARFSLFANVGP
jgi:hypothetical protein